MNAMILPIFILWKGVLEIYNLSFILDCTYNTCERTNERVNERDQVELRWKYRYLMLLI